MRSRTPYCQLDWRRVQLILRVHGPPSKYSSNLVPSDFQLSKRLKKQVAGKQFATDADVKQAVTSRRHTIFF